VTAADGIVWTPEGARYRGYRIELVEGEWLVYVSDRFTAASFPSFDAAIKAIHEVGR
jgi:hypothetical protein